MDKGDTKIIKVTEYSGERIDKYISLIDTTLTRSHIQKLIKDEKVKVNNKMVKANFKVSLGDELIIDMPEPESLNIKAIDIPLDILYEDNDIVVVNKPKNMVVHPAIGHTEDTLVNALLFHCKDNLSGISGVRRPGIVHRIDKDTTGVLVVCKHDESHNWIADQLREHSITRKYEAIVYDNIKEDEGVIDAPIGRHPNDRLRNAINYENGKSAVTHYRVLERLNNKYTHIECVLETGRTHQIRVHMASIKHPLLGDELYGPKQDNLNLQGQTLHAKVLGFIHPTTKQYVEFSAPLPDYFVELLDKLRK